VRAGGDRFVDRLDDHAPSPALASAMVAAQAGSSIAVVCIVLNSRSDRTGLRGPIGLRVQRRYSRQVPSPVPDSSPSTPRTASNIPRGPVWNSGDSSSRIRE
jgi:hypothetical protein